MYSVVPPKLKASSLGLRLFIDNGDISVIGYLSSPIMLQATFIDCGSLQPGLPL